MKTAKALTVFLKSDQARLFYLALAFFLALFILSFIYFPGLIKFINSLILIGLLLILFFYSFSRAHTSGKLRLEEDLLSSIVENLQDAVISYDEDFKILNFNKSAQDLFQIKASEILGKNFTIQNSANKPKQTLLRQVMFPSLAPSIRKVSAAGEYPQVVNLSFDSPYLELQSITIPIKGKDGKNSAFVKIIHNRTRQISLAKSKDEFVTVASHQLRTPLSAVTWAFQELSKSNLSDQQRQEIFQTGAKAAKKLSNILQDFLNIAKIEEGRFGYDFKEEDLSAFVAEAVAQASNAAKQNEVKLYFEKPSKAIKLVMDKAKIAMVLSNLLDNAIKYNVKNGSVIVKITPKTDEPFVEITIEDTGVGLKGEEINKLFEKFFRSETVTKIDPTGTGLGLYIAKNIIRQHGGQIWAESIFGRGSTFHFTLPTDESLIPQREVGTS